jgi:hypothetical protein
VNFVLQISASLGYAVMDTFPLVIGQKPVLLVDDDGGDSYQTYFFQALDSVGINYEVWTYATQGCPPDSVLDDYQAVIWTTGKEYGSLSNPKTLIALDQQRLMTYLDNGGRLLLSSQDFLLDNSPNTFITDYLHVAGHDDDESVLAVAGVAGDTVSNGMSMTLSYPFYNFSDHIFPGTGAVGILYQTAKETAAPRAGVQLDRYSPEGAGAGPVNYCALRYPASGPSVYRVIFLAFPFEAVPQSGADPDNSYTLMRRMMNWFGLGRTGSQYMHGDANGDQILDVADAVFLLNYLYKNGDSPVPEECGDANCNGQVDLEDAIYLLNYLYRNGNPPPC